MFAKEIYIARRKALLEKMAQTAPQGKRGIALFVGNVALVIFLARGKKKVQTA